MESQPLFLDKAVEFDGAEKLAGMLTRMSDNTDRWQQEIIQEAYKQCPYLSEFEPAVVLDKVDEERGFAFGSIEIRPKTAMTVDERQEAGLEVAHIPVIIKEQMLSPFDVFLHGKRYYHLTEGRLRECLFRPDAFDVSRTRPYDPAIIQDLQPPVRAGYGGFGSGGAKTGSVSQEIQALPLLPLLHGSVRKDHVDRFKVAMQDPSIQAQITNGDEGVRAAFQSADGLTVSDLKKTAEFVSRRIKPNVIQFKKLATNRALLKWANTDMFAPQEQQLPMSVAQDMMGEQDMIQQLENDGTVTMSPDAEVKKTLEAEEIKVADSFGLWKVQDKTGSTMIGWVFPKLLTLDLHTLPLSLFNNGSQHAVQEHVAGEPAGKSLDLPKTVPQGYGALYYFDHGTAKAFVPMTIKSVMRSPNGIQYLAECDLGTTMAFSFGEGLKMPVKVGESDFVLPAFFNWMPLRGKTELVSEPGMFSKLGAAGRSGSVDIVGDHGVFSFRGPAIAKVAEAHTKFIDHDKAMFLGVALGMTPAFCKEALDRASHGSRESVSGLRVLGSVGEKMGAIREKIAREIEAIDPPIHNYHLFKEASVLDDALTADKILGLGFLNSENISTFIDLLPALDAASSKLAELLVATRIGLKEVPEVAVERMLAALEDVIRGLKSLRQKEQASYAD